MGHSFQSLTIKTIRQPISSISNNSLNLLEGLTFRSIIRVSKKELWPTFDPGGPLFQQGKKNHIDNVHSLPFKLFLLNFCFAHYFTRERLTRTRRFSCPDKTCSRSTFQPSRSHSAFDPINWWSPSDCWRERLSFFTRYEYKSRPRLMNLFWTTAYSVADPVLGSWLPLHLMLNVIETNSIVF